ncbi:inositol polyphosphate-4-phosphatase type I A-like [Dysidea avara]|uniref:inositol polyphosphate-4-phosphatase type I A-like n=1 Tax=Dysidea avara TaxID=196820 RepID=UPI00332500CA
MKFNVSELAAYCSSRKGKADKEGTLWLKERSDGLFSRKASFHKRWFRLLGNLLFYLASDDECSSVAGVIVLERSTIENDTDSGNKYGFVIAFDDCMPQYTLYANTAREADEWITVLQQATYQHMLSTLAELRGRLLQITGKDPLPDSHPLYETPTQYPMTGSAPASDTQGEPLLELSIACSSLVTEESGRVPNSFVLTSCLTQPQAFWFRYAQTEIIQTNCDPRFFTTVILYNNHHLSLNTQLKLEVFDVHERNEGSLKMKPIGQAHLTILDVFQAPNNKLRLEIKWEDAIRGFIMLRGRKASESNSPKSLSFSRQLSESQTSETDFDSSLGFAFENLCVRKFQFPVWNKDYGLQVCEVMAETDMSFTIPMLLLERFIIEENSQVQEYCSLVGLNEHWEIVRQEVIEVHGTMMAHYREVKKHMEKFLQQGERKFKKSVEKQDDLLEFVPTNLHIQQMCVAEADGKDQLAYNVVTVGAPTAYNLKYRNGGLIKWQTTAPYCYANIFSHSHDNKTVRARNILNHLNRIHVEIYRQCDIVLSAAQEMSREHLKAAFRKLADKVNKLRGHCDVMLMNDAVRSLHNQLQENAGIKQESVGDLCLKVEEHVLCVEMRVDAVLSNLDGTDDWHSVLQTPISDMRSALASIVDKLQKAIYFLFLQETHKLILDKVPIGIKGYRHRHDIAFTQAVSTVVTSFILQLQSSILDNAFLIQLQQIGFLLHWESLLSTHGDEIGMLEDFIVVMQNINVLTIKIVSSNDNALRIEGRRYNYTVRVPLSPTLFRLLPTPLQEGKAIKVCAVLLTQGINEQQTMADAFGDNSLQDVINNNNFQKLSSYCYRFCDIFSHANAANAHRAKRAQDLLESLRSQITAKKNKNTDILSLSQELCRYMRCGRVTSCKSAKDRTAMSVTLEQVLILCREFGMDPSSFQHALDATRSQGTRLENALKNVSQPLYAFNALQILALPKNYRPPDGTYKKLQT